jgi:hypothetical protein
MATTTFALPRNGGRLLAALVLGLAVVSGACGKAVPDQRQPRRISARGAPCLQTS